MSRSVINIIGQKFGRLLVLTRAGSNSDKKATWNCLCDCGNNKVLSGKELRQGKIKSCGCLRSDLISKEFIEQCKKISERFK